MPTLTVAPGTDPLRLDSFLARTVPGCSRRSAQRVIAAGRARINGHRARKGDVVTDGDAVDVPDELYAPPALQPNPALAVAVLYEDAAVIALDKPAGMPSHALRADETETIVNFLLARFPEVATVGARPLEPGIVHRLDTDTSGVLLAARTRGAFQALRQQFTARAIIKEYLALVAGDVRQAGVVDAPLAHAAHNRRKMRVCVTPDTQHGARAAVTSYEPLERFGQHTLLRIEIRTGVMHQIRVHLASIGHPVTGDRLYGHAEAGAPSRHFLHAVRVGFVHPTTGQAVEISSPLPADLVERVEALRVRG